MLPIIIRMLQFYWHHLYNLQLQLCLFTGTPRKFDPEFHGPIKQRGCTDVCCLILLICFLVGWGVIAFIGKIFILLQI